MTEPQLSAEQKKEWVVKSISKWMSESQEGMATHVLSNYVNEKIATALEEQRMGYVEWANDKIAKCERLKGSEYVNESDDYFRGKIAILNDLLAILNGKE